MLVALLRANANAFINGNLNLLKAGAVLTIPTDEQAAAVSDAEASRTVIAQSKDFNAFRAKLAGNAPTQQVAAADRSRQWRAANAGRRQAHRRAAPDKLTLSKGAADAKAAADKIAQGKGGPGCGQARSRTDPQRQGPLQHWCCVRYSGDIRVRSHRAPASAPAPRPVTIVAAAPAVARAGSRPVVAARRGSCRRRHPHL